MSSIGSTNEKSGDYKLEEPIEGLIKPQVEFTIEEEDKLLRRMDWRVMPILALLYLFSFMDRGNIGNARLYSLEADLGMLGTSNYNLALSVYFVTYCAFEIPANLALNFLEPSVWLSAITLAWGIVMTGMGFVQNTGGLVACRLMLGITEAGLFPGVTFILTLFYPRYKTQFRIALFSSAATSAGAFSGLLAYAIGFMNGLGGYNAWRWIFIVEGSVTILIAILAYFVVVDSLATAKFLKPAERDWLIYRKALDLGSAGEANYVTREFVIAGLTDWQTWLGTAIYISINVSVYSISLFLPTIINSFGTYTRPQVQLLTIPVYFAACCNVLTCAYYADKLQTRFRFVVANQSLAVLGFLFNIIIETPQPLKYVGLIFIAMGAYGAVSTSITWLANNSSGSTKRAIAMAVQISVANLGAIASSNVYRTVDSPKYYLGHGTCLGFLTMGLIAAPTYAYLLKKENARRAVIRAQELALPIEQRRVYTVKELHYLGDRAPDFVYTI